MVSPDYGVVKVDTNPTKVNTQEIINLIAPQIQRQAYKENIGVNANWQFSFGRMWSRVNLKAKPLLINSFAGVEKTKQQIAALKKAGLTVDKSKYIYDYHELDQNGNVIPALSVLQPLIDKIQNALGIDMSDYDSMLGNIYLDNQSIAPHRDTTEAKSAKGYPVVVYTIGNNSGLGIWDDNKGKITFQGAYKEDYQGRKPTNEIATKDGTIYTFGMGGKGRFALSHTTPLGNIKKNSFPPIKLSDGRVITNYTITLTFRRAADLEPGMPKTPARLTTQPSTSLPGAETKINIYARTNENADLSNFAIRPFKPNFSEELFSTVEGAFQAAKFQYTESFLRSSKNLTKEDIDTIKKLQKVTGAEAKQIGKTIQNLNVREWDTYSSQVMKELLLESFKQNPGALQRLLDTGNATLTHTQDKSKWGTEFPKLLMKVREELRSTQPSTQSTISTGVTPVNISPISKIQSLKELLTDVSTDQSIFFDTVKPLRENVFEYQDNNAMKNVYSMFPGAMFLKDGVGVTEKIPNKPNVIKFDILEINLKDVRNDKGILVANPKLKADVDNFITQLKEDIRDKNLMLSSKGYGQSLNNDGYRGGFLYLSNELLKNFGYYNPGFITQSSSQKLKELVTSKQPVSDQDVISNFVTCFK